MNNLPVTKRLTLTFGVLIALLITVAGIALLRLSDMNQALDLVVNDRAPKLEAINDMAIRSMDNARIVRNLILMTDETAKLANKKALDKNLAENAARVASLNDQFTAEDDRKRLKELDALRTAYMHYTLDVVDLALANKGEEATKALYGDGYKTQGLYFAAIRDMVDKEKASMKASAAEAGAGYTVARNMVLGMAALACLVGIAMAVFITRGLLRQLGGEPLYATSVARRIAAGDLGTPVKVKADDESSLLAAMGAMQANLASVVSNVRMGSDSVATASAEIAQGNQDLSQRTEQQASSLEETASSMEQLGTTIKQNAENAHQANQLALGASAVATRGGDVVGQVVETMKEINGSSKKIVDIIAVIDGIAFQTNILALNAAVEAARAGEQGRGFAVVASEVRSLAQRSAGAAKEIKALITASVERVEQGTALVDVAGVTMSEIVSSIKRVTDIMSEISTASTEQAAGVSQVVESVAKMDQATQQNSALVEESAAAAESLRFQSKQLVEAVALFKLNAGAQIAVPAVQPPATAKVVERRGPNRASNVTRPNFVAARPPAAPVVAKPPQAGDRTGTDDWTSF